MLLQLNGEKWWRLSWFFPHVHTNIWKGKENMIIAVYMVCKAILDFFNQKKKKKKKKKQNNLALVACDVSIPLQFLFQFYIFNLQLCNCKCTHNLRGLSITTTHVTQFLCNWVKRNYHLKNVILCTATLLALTFCCITHWPLIF